MSVVDRITSVCFAPTSSVALDVSPGELIFYDVVDAAVAVRSSVLSCIAEAGGEARLPEAVSVPDFRCWIRACKADQWDRATFDFSTLCILLKVADALDDKCADEWVTLAVDRLVSASQKHEAAVNHPQPANPEARVEDPDRNHTSPTQAAQELLHLPHAVQHQVYAAASAHGMLHSMLAWLPQHLHTSVLSAAITAPDQTLQMIDCRDPQRFLAALAALPAAPPSVLSLQAHCMSWEIDAGQTLPQHLAEALVLHSGLTSLSLELYHDCTDTVSVLAPAIATLTSLRTLHLGASTAPLPVATLPDLQHALHTLPQLADLYISLEHDPRLRQRKRARCSTPRSRASRGQQTSQPSLTAMLSAAAALTSLTIHLQTAGHPEGGEAMFMGSTAAVLPHLRHLTASVHDCSWATPLLRSLAAPLTSLTLQQAALSRLPDTEADRALFAQSLSAFSQLRSLRLGRQHDSWAIPAIYSALRLPPAHAPLRELRLLKLATHFVWMCMAAPLLATATPALQRLTVSLTSDASTIWDTRPSEPAWADLIHHLSHLQLHRLDLAFKGRGDASGPCMSALRPLTCLSALRLQAVAAPPDLHALAALTQLQLLHLHGFDLSEGASGGLTPCLRVLRGLTNVVLCGRGVREALVEAIAVGGVEGACPALQRLGLQLDTSVPVEEHEAAVSAACRLPALQRLVLMLDGGTLQWSPLAPPPPEAVPESLRAIAAAAGVTAMMAPRERRPGFASLDDVFG